MNFSIVLLPVVVIVAIMVLYFLPKWWFRFPARMRKRLPMALGVMGGLLLIYCAVNSILSVRQLVLDPVESLAKNKVTYVHLPTAELIPEMTEEEKARETAQQRQRRLMGWSAPGIHELDVHLVLVEKHGSLVPSDWTISQWRAAAGEGFDELELNGGGTITLRGLQMAAPYIMYVYQIDSQGYSSSGASSTNIDRATQPEFLDNKQSGSRGPMALISIAEVMKSREVYFFVSKRDDPLAAVALGDASAKLGEMAGMRSLDSVETRFGRLNSVSPSGILWANWLGVSVMVLVLLVTCTSLLFPWRFAYSFVGLWVVCVLASIGLDRWSVGYTSDVVADLEMPAESRYLAMQQLQSSFFWQLTANHAFMQADTEGMSEEVRDQIQRQRNHLQKK